MSGGDEKFQKSIPGTKKQSLIGTWKYHFIFQSWKGSLKTTKSELEDGFTSYDELSAETSKSTNSHAYFFRAFQSLVPTLWKARLTK